MKANILILVALFLMASTYTESQKPNMALVEKVNGLYVFVKSEPVMKFEKLGTVKSANIINSYKADYLLEHMTSRAKEKHNTCNAVMFTNGTLTECEALKITE
jgi:hypothetical protein